MSSSHGTAPSFSSLPRVHNRVPILFSFDRYRSTLKGTWKDLPLPANGLTFDLAAHLIDQVLVLFGRPAKVTAFIENLRGIGSPEVDDNVRTQLFKVICPHNHFFLVHHTSPLSSSACGLRGSQAEILHSTSQRNIAFGTFSTITLRRSRNIGDVSQIWR